MDSETNVLHTIAFSAVGSPFSAQYFDTSSVVATWEKINLIAANRSAQFELDPRGLPAAEVTFNIRGTLVTLK